VLGVMFGLLEQVVVDATGEDGWDDVLDRAGSHGVYVAAGCYPDDDLRRLLAATWPDRSPYDRLRCFAERTAALLPDRYPAWFAGTRRTVEVLSVLGDMVRAEVLRLHPSVDVPLLEVHHDPAVAQYVALGFPSRDDWCALAEGLVHGLAGHFSEQARVSHVKCVRTGSGSCLVVCDVHGGPGD